VLFQLLIALTGNYGFFNLLTIALALLLVDDSAWPRWLQWGKPIAPIRRRPWVRRSILAPVFAVILLISVVDFVATCGLSVDWPEPVLRTRSWIARLESINSYGLFAVMTTTRPEIIVEGSDDGRNWLEYEFK